MNAQCIIKILLSSVTSTLWIPLGVISLTPTLASAMELVPASLEPSANSVDLCWGNSTLGEAEVSRNCDQEQQLSTSDHLLFERLTNPAQPYALLTHSLMLGQFDVSNTTSNHLFSKFSLITDWLASPAKLSSSIAFSQKPQGTTGYIASSDSKSVHFAAAKSRTLPIFSIIGASFGILGLRYVLKLLVDD